MVPWVYPTQPPNVISIGLAVFSGLVHKRDQRTDTHTQTDRPTT